jgi:hypothetical protein
MSNLKAFMMTTIGAGAARITTLDTVTYGLLETFDETRYYLNSLLHQSPLDKNIILNTFGDGVAHVTDAAKKISFRKSTDSGLTFGAKATVYDPTDSNFQIQDPGAGYDSNGRFHIFADCHNNFASSGQTHELRYMFSDDDCTTISSPVVITLPAISLATFRMYGRMIQNNNVLMVPAYFQTEEGDTTNSARYILRSTDFGANWTWVEVSTGTTYINESELLGVDNDTVIMVSRHEVVKQFNMYKSSDNGLTWINCNVLGTGVVMATAGPCRLLKFFLDDGTEVAGMYFPDRSNDRLYGLYGKIENFIIGGVGGWNLNTLTLLRQDTEYLHYGDMSHYDRNMNAFGAWPREASATPLVDNELVYFTNPTTQYGKVFSILTPSTIYDHLALPAGIYSWRGLLANNTNDYGTVNVSSQVTLLKSLEPGPTNRNFSATAGGIILGDGMEFDGTKALTHSTAITFDFLSNSSAGYTDVNWTITWLGKIGNSSNPNAAYSIFGNNGTSAANIGLAIFFDDRAAVPRNNALVMSITAGGLTFIINFSNDNILTPNIFLCLTIECDLSLGTTNDKVKIYVNGVLQSTTVTTFNTGVVAPPTFGAQIGASGNNVLPFVGSMKHLVIQNSIDIAQVRNELIDTLMDLEGL